eukprot:gene12608-15834_t
MALDGDNFRGAEISGAPTAFDANQYGFFGNLSGAGGLDDGIGGLEDWLDAPPEEEVVDVALPDEFDAKFTFDDTELVVDNEEDLSIASMLFNQSRLEQQRDRAIAELQMMQPMVPLQPADWTRLDGSDPFQGLNPLPADMQLELKQGPCMPSSSLLSSSLGSYGASSGMLVSQLPPSRSSQPTPAKKAPMSAEELEQQLLGDVDASAAATVNTLAALLGMTLGNNRTMGQHTQGIDLLGVQSQAPVPPPQPPSLPPTPQHLPPSGLGQGFLPPGSMPQSRPNFMQPPPGGAGPQMGPPGMGPPGMGPPGMGPPGMGPPGMGPPGMGPTGMNPYFRGQPPPPGQRPPPPGPNAYFFPGNAGPPPSGHPDHMMMRPPPPRPPPFHHGPHGGPPPPGGPNRFGDANGRHMLPYDFSNGPHGPQHGQAPAPSTDANIQFQRQRNMQEYRSQSGWVGDQNHHNQGQDRRRMPGGKLMSSSEMEHIMHIMYQAVHTGTPYQEDYYHQALINTKQPERNTSSFFPDVLRDLSDDVARLDPSNSVVFAPAEGLGKVVYSNIRTPRVLMDLTVAADAAAEAKKDADGTTSDAAAKPLEQEPLLAARMMVEDCMHLLLDVDDLDRIFASAHARSGPRATSRLPPPHSAKRLRLRRVMLLAGIAESFRLPDSPDGSTPPQAAAEPATGGRNDGVFLRIMALPKGRGLLAQTLRLLEPPSHQANAVDEEEAPAWMDDSTAETGTSASIPTSIKQPIHLLWAVLRSAGTMFSPQGLGVSASAGPDAALVAKSMADATSRLATSVSYASVKLQTPEHLVDALTSLLTGLEKQWQQRQKEPSQSSFTEAKPGTPADILPLANMRAGENPQKQDWLGEAIAALVSRAEGLGLFSSCSALKQEITGIDATLQVKWDRVVEKLFAALLRHLDGLAVLHAAAQANNSAETKILVRNLLCQPLMRAMAAQASEEQRRTLKDAMKELQ